LLVKIPTQPIELFRLAQILGADDLVELGGERPIVGTARLVEPMMTRPPGLVRGLRIAHVGVFRHVGRIGITRVGGAVGPLVGGHLGLFERDSLGIVGLLGFAFAGCIVLATVLIPAVILVILGVAAAVVAHVERVEQIMHRIGEAALVIDQFFKPIEI